MRRLCLPCVLVPLAFAGLVAAALQPCVPKGCGDELTRPILQQSLALGTQFLVAHQLPEGNFNYQYDWQTRTFDPGDHQVRQAGALWGLVLIDQHAPSAPLATAIERGLSFFNQRSVEAAPDGPRFIRYPGDNEGALGTIALVALAHIDHLRARELSPATRASYQHHLDGYLKHLVSARQADGLFHGAYDLETGQPRGAASSYYDGESLLALVKACRYLHYEHLRVLTVQSALAGHELNVRQALRANPDSDVTKGYYQWSSMAFYELATSGWPDTDVFGEHLAQLADWMIDVHQTLNRVRNTGYAHEGIVHALAYAKAKGWSQRAAKFRCVARAGLEKLTQWQVGSPLQNTFIGGTGPDDPLAIGGVQNHAGESGLRIDVAQHQMHAVLLAIKHLW